MPLSYCTHARVRTIILQLRTSSIRVPDGAYPVQKAPSIEMTMDHPRRHLPGRSGKEKQVDAK